MLICALKANSRGGSADKTDSAAVPSVTCGHGLLCVSARARWGCANTGDELPPLPRLTVCYSMCERTETKVRSEFLNILLTKILIIFT